MNLAQIVDKNVQRIPNWTAVLSEQAELTWLEFSQQVNRMGNSLRKLGIAKGDRVAMYLPNSPEYLVTYFAIAKLGAIAVPFNIMYKGHEINYIVNNANVKALVAAADEFQENVLEIREHLISLVNIIIVGNHQIEGALSYGDMIANGYDYLEPVECSKDDVVTILYTSGTTGQPKGAMLTHGNFYYNAELNGCFALHVSDQDRFFTGTPFCHIFFVLTVLGPMYKGAAVVTAPRFFPDKALELISKFKVTHFAGVPTMWIYMLQTYKNDLGRYDLTSLRFAQSAGAAMPAEYIPQVEKTFNVGFCECYGSTETSSTCTYGRLGHGKAGSIGLPADTWEVKVVDEEEQEVAIGEVGELFVKGPGVFKGYWEIPEATKAAFTGEWFHTGDLGRSDEDGYLYIVDRKKDMLICGGYNIYPREVEEVLYTHPSVLEVAVIGIPDPAKGEIPKAYITTKLGSQSVTEEDLISFCKEQMAAYKVPRIFEFIKELPKNATGKILKRALREITPSSNQTTVI